MLLVDFDPKAHVRPGLDPNLFFTDSKPLVHHSASFIGPSELRLFSAHECEGG